MKTLSFCILFLSVNCLWSQITLEKPEKLWGTNHVSSQTPIKDQGNGNSCSAFGIAAALEMLPNMPKDISENFLYAAHKYEQLDTKTGITRGNFLKSYIHSLPKYGILLEAELPYPKVLKGEWNDNDSELKKALSESTSGPISFLLHKDKARLINLDSYKYLGQKESKNVKYLKKLLDDGIKAIPVSYNLYMPAWNNEKTKKYTTITPDIGYGILMKDGTYTKHSVFKEEHPNINERINSNLVRFKQTDKRTDVNRYGAHVVTIVGYDTEGFIIKNSWGIDWRFKGYERVSFDYHELFAYEALILKKVSYKYKR